MRTILHAVAFVWLASVASAADVSYWWSQMLSKPDAKQSQAFFFVPGTNVVFTYQTNRVIINSGGGGGTNTYVTNNIYVTNNNYYTNYFTNYTVGVNATQTITMFNNNLFTTWTNVFSNGLLVASGPVGSSQSHLIQPAGNGNLLQANLGLILLP